MHIMTSSGRLFPILEPHSYQFSLEEIGWALSGICRFTAQCREHYSVAQHSIHVANLLPPHLRFAGLMHDASEAYLGDVSQPLKQLLPEYKAIERRVELAIGVQYMVDMFNPTVKTADVHALAVERKVLMPVGHDDWWPTVSPELPVLPVNPWPREYAFNEWMDAVRSIWTGA